MNRPTNKAARSEARKHKQAQRLKRSGRAHLLGTPAAKHFMDTGTPCSCPACDPHKRGEGEKHAVMKRMGK